MAARPTSRFAAECPERFRFDREGGVSPNAGLPKVGDSLFFQSSGRDLVTSAVLSVERPPQQDVGTYEN